MVAARPKDGPLCPRRAAAGHLRPHTPAHRDPAKGDPDNFSLFLQLLDEDAYADVKSIREAMDRAAPFYLRRTKEAMVYFPERQPDGTWKARRSSQSATRRPSISDRQRGVRPLRDVTRFVKGRAPGGRRTETTRVPCRRLPDGALSAPAGVEAHADALSLENRARRLTESLKRAQEIARTAPRDLPTRRTGRDGRRGARTAGTHPRRDLAGRERRVSAGRDRRLKQLADQAKTVETAGPRRNSRASGILMRSRVLRKA